MVWLTSWRRYVKRGYDDFHTNLSERDGLADFVETLQPSSALCRLSYHACYGVGVKVGEEVLLGDFALVELVKLESVADIGGNDLATTLTDNEVGIAGEKLLNGKYTHFGCHYSVTKSGGTTAHYVCKAGKLGINTRFDHYLLSKGRRVIGAYALGYEDYEVTLAVTAGNGYLAADIIIVGGELGNYGGSSACGNACGKRNITRTATHNLNNVTSRVGLAGIAKLINEIYYGIHSGIKADGSIGGGNIVVDSAGNTNAGNAVRGKIGGTAECAVAADGNDTVNAELAAGLNRLFNTLFGLELRATVRVKHRTALIDYIGYVAQTERLDIAADKTRISSVYTYYLNAVADSRAYDRSYSGVHTGGVTAGGKYTYRFKFFHFLSPRVSEKTKPITLVNSFLEIIFYHIFSTFTRRL